MSTLFDFNNLSIRKKIRVAVLFTTIFVLVLTSTALVSMHLITYRHNMLKELTMLSNLVGLNSIAGLLFDNPSTAQENMAALEASDKVIFTHILGENNNLFVSYFNENFEQEASDEYDIRDYYKAEISNPSHYVLDSYFFSYDAIDIFSTINVRDKRIGTVHIRASLKELNQHFRLSVLTALGILVFASIIATIIALRLQRVITSPLYTLLHIIQTVSNSNTYSVRAEKKYDDEVGSLVGGFNEMLDNIERRDRELEHANQEISSLNDQLKADNLRMSAELDVTRRLQQMVLPSAEELKNIPNLDIAGYMNPADEVGGDYYDVIPLADGGLRVGIGDVTGHGLESGVLMLMVQTAVRTLLKSDIRQSHDFVNILNRTIHDNVQRMNTDKNLTFSILEYNEGKISITGQHEEVLIFRKNGQVERIDTIDLGFMVGLQDDIQEFIAEVEKQLEPGDGVILYTDGVTEARNQEGQQYGLDRLCRIAQQTWQEHKSTDILDTIIRDVHEYMGDMPLQDDVTLVVMKHL